MKKRFSIYHVLIVVLIFSMFSPISGVFADSNSPKGKLTIYKFEQEPGTEKGQPGDGAELNPQPEGKPLEGVEFTFTQTHAYDPATDKWTAVNGKTFTKTTNANGKIVLNNIDLGRYTVQETDGPPHVVLNTKEYSVDIPMTNEDGSSVNYDVHIYPKNETIRGGATLTKYKDGTDETLDGVEFQVFHKDGEPVLDKNGEPIILTTTNGIVTVEGLAFGIYYFKEKKSTDGYLLNGEEIQFTINEQGEHVEVELQNYKKPEVKKAVNNNAVNRGEIVTYTITVDLPADINEYNSFTIIDELDANLEYVDNSEVSPDGFTFKKNGQTLTWEKTGYLDPEDVSVSFDAKVSENAEANKVINNEAKIVYYNGYEAGGDRTPKVPVTPTAGLLKIFKQDGDSEEALAGAEFELRDSEGNKVSSGTTGANGILDFGELDYGNYQLVEIKAPEGYRMLTKPINITIGGGENQDQTIEVNNYKSGWELPKTGGIGTTLFTAIGTLLMALAFYLYTRRRKETV